MRALVMIKVELGDKKMKELQRRIDAGEIYEVQDYISHEVESWLIDSFDDISVETIEMERPSWN